MITFDDFMKLDIRIGTVTAAEKVQGAIVEGDLIFTKKSDGTKDKIGIMQGEKAVQGFSTPSGRVEFYNADFAKRKD